MNVKFSVDIFSTRTILITQLNKRNHYFWFSSHRFVRDGSFVNGQQFTSSTCESEVKWRCMQEMETNTSETTEKRQLTTEDWINLTNYFVGNNYRFRENIIIPKNLGPVKIKTNEEKMVEAAFESCAFKSFMSCVLGWCAFSSFFAPITSWILRLRPGRCNRFVFVECGSVGDERRTADGPASLPGNENDHFELRKEFCCNRSYIFRCRMHDRIGKLSITANQSRHISLIRYLLGTRQIRLA